MNCRQGFSLLEWAEFAAILAGLVANKGIVNIHPANRLNEVIEQVKTLQVFLVTRQRAMRFVVLEVAITPRYVSQTELHWFVSCATFKKNKLVTNYTANIMPNTLIHKKN